MEDVLEDNAQYSSARAIVGVAGPACILNAAAPITAVVQSALLGRHCGSAALGAFGAVSITAGFATRVFNFLVDGVSAKIGRSVGLRAWDEVGSRVKMSLFFALSAGAVAALVLACLITPVSVDILKLTPEVQAEARLYWWLRVGLVPLQLLHMAVSGILQGFRRVQTSAAINSAQALLETAGSALVLGYGVKIGQHDGLFAMGLVGLAVQVLALVAGIVCILALPPVEAGGKFSLWQEWFGRRKSSRSGLQESLLAADGMSQHDSVASLPTAAAVDASAASAAQLTPSETLLDFVSDGINMWVRSMILQTTFFASLVAASRLGTPSLAAHSVINQLWVLVSYAVDGFAAAGIVLGSRLVAQAHDPLRAANAKHHLQLLIGRVLLAGVVAGVAAAATFAAARDATIAMFTGDPAAAAVLKHGTWAVLTLCQPTNALVFVYDGLLYASQSFRFIRNYMTLGFLVVFCPILATELYFWNELWGVWVANAAFNLWRVGGAAYLIHWIFMAEFDSQLVPPGAPAAV